MALALRYAARSHVGLVRTGNEDSGYAGPTMLVVADGMGGHAAGELASAAAVAAFAAIEAESSGTESEVLTELAAGVARTTDTIRGVVGERPQLTGMGTTLTALAWRAGLINVAHVGDSRAYLLRDGQLQQMTHDHTYVQLLVDTGRITPEEALTHARRNLIMRAIDGLNDVEPDLQAREAHVGDRYLLCSDGLCGVVAEHVLAQILAMGDPTYAVTALVEAALEAGAPDNVTAVVADVVAVDDDSAEALIDSEPVVVGAASESRTRERLSSVTFPSDVEPGLAPVAITPDQGVESAVVVNQRTPLLRRWWPVVVALGAVVVVLAVSAAVTSWLWSQYFVGSSNGTVVIYQGINQSIPGIPLSRIIKEPQPPLLLSSLPEADRQSVETTIDADDLAAAERRVEDLRAQAVACTVTWKEGCPGPKPIPVPTPLPTPLPTMTPSVSPSGGTA